MRKFKELKDKVLTDETSRKAVEAYTTELLAELSLAEVRRARQMTQEELATALRTTQSGVSRLEHQADLYVSTLRRYIQAAGGKLEIYAVFPESRIPIELFACLDSDIEGHSLNER
jgi:transcriptional regulator with XRE-family HTH domain